MMRLSGCFFSLVFSCVALLPSQVVGQSMYYEDAQFHSMAADHEVIAVLPLDVMVKWTPKELRDTAPELLLRMEDAKGLDIQSYLTSWYLSRKEKRHWAVVIQAPHVTNALLIQNGLALDSLAAYTPMQLSAMLGVDAVILGSFKTGAPVSRELGIVLNLIFLWTPGSPEWAQMDLSLYDAETGILMSNYKKFQDARMWHSSDAMINALMRKASRKTDYPRQKSE